MPRALTAIAAATLALLSGCNATMGDLPRHVDDVATSVQAAVTPRQVTVYKAYADSARPVLEAGITAMKQAGVVPKVEAVKVTFRDPIGRVFESPTVVKTYRVAIPEDAIEAESKELQPLLTALGAKVTEWSATEPYELVVVSSDSGGAGYLVAQMHKAAPGIKVTKVVGPVSSAGYAGVEMRMVNANLNRQLAAATATSATK